MSRWEFSGTGARAIVMDAVKMQWQRIVVITEVSRKRVCQPLRDRYTREVIYKSDVMEIAEKANVTLSAHER